MRRITVKNSPMEVVWLLEGDAEIINNKVPHYKQGTYM